MEQPFVSIVLATHNRLPLLQSTLATLLAQDYPKECYEIIVVNDASSDGTVDWLRALPPCWQGVAFTSITLTPSGPCKARNAGILRARGEYVMITDDDCFVDEHCVRSLVADMLAHPCGGILGRIVCQERPGVISRYCTHIHFNVTAEDAQAPAPFINTANGFFPRSVLYAVGGFDEAYAHLGSEDFELSQRILELGYHLRQCPPALVLHLNKVTARSLHRALYNQSRGMAYIHAKRSPHHRVAYVAGYTGKLLLNFIRIVTEAPVRIVWNLVTRRLSIVDAVLFPLLARTTKIYSMCGRITGRLMYWHTPKAQLPLCLFMEEEKALLAPRELLDATHQVKL
jgi:GT2 family glycosyltransferase